MLYRASVPLQRSMGDVTAFQDYESEFLRVSNGLSTRISAVTTYEADGGAHCGVLHGAPVPRCRVSCGRRPVLPS